MAEKSADVKKVLEDDLPNDLPEDLHEDLLEVPGRVSLVNSPTTDTLDSVALEPSPTEEVEEDGEGKKDVEEEQKTEIDIRAGGDSEGAITFQAPSSDTTSSGEVNTGPTDVTEVKGQGDGSSGSGGKPNLSSYFGTPANTASGEDFFDSVSGQMPLSPKDPNFQQGGQLECDDGLQALTESQYDSLTGGKTPPLEEDDHQNVVPEIVQTEVPHEEDHSELLHEDNQPESIPFEGETLGPSHLRGSSIDLLNKSSFEHFTCEEPLGPSGDGNEITKSTSQDLGTVNAEQARLYPNYQQSNQTPTQLSPLSTPSHQTASIPPSQQSPGAYNYSQPPGFDHQNSIPSGPPSPFRKFESTSSTPPAIAAFADAVDDLFTASLSMSDTDRRYDAWLPSDATRHILVTMATSAPGTCMPAPEQLSCPRVMTSEPQGDPVRDLVYRYIGEQEAIKRKVLSGSAVPQDVTGLERLISAGCLRAAVDLTGKLLANAGQGETTGGEPSQQSQYTLQLWFCRLSLLVRLRLYDMAETELRGFQALDTPDLYYEFYPHVYPGRRGSMVPFGMRLLHAEIPSFMARSQEALDKLYYVLAVVNRIQGHLDSGLAEDSSMWEMSSESRTKSIELWKKREMQTLNKIASVMVHIKDYDAALSVYDIILEKDNSCTEALHSGIGRIHLQMGNVPDALDIFKKLEADSEKGDNSASCRNTINRGLVAMCQNSFSEAYTHFKLAVQLEPHNTCAVNNMAVCSLYLGRLKDALNTLESLVHRDPANNLHEGILFNLCTLYELESSRALHKKQTMLDLVSRHKGDGFPVVCLKMT